jgi:hypothetical protein
MSAHAMLHQKDNCVRSLERKSKSVPEPDKEVVRKQANCPKCRHINTTDCQTECPKCSIVYSQYQLVVKKAFDNTFVVIGRNGLETAEAELNALAARYPSIKATCDQYSAFINHAIKKHLAGNHELSHDYFDRLVNKQPVLKDAVVKFSGEKEAEDTKDENKNFETETDIARQSYTIDKIRASVNKKGALVACGILLFIIVTSLLVNRDDHVNLNRKEYSINRITPDNKKSTAPLVTPVSAGYTEAFLLLMNKYYGNICKIEVHGIFSRTLKVDWTPNTNKLYALKVVAEIGDAKILLYEEGVRYFQFPNNLCRYNVIDWKTGEKESISDRAPYCFTD